MSSQGLLEGFKTGWGMMNQHNQQEENKRRYDQQFGLQKENHEMSKENHGMKQALHTMQIQNAELERQVKQFAVDKQPETYANEQGALKQRTATNKQIEQTSNARQNVNEFALATAKFDHTQKKLVDKIKAGVAAGNVSKVIMQKDFDGTSMAILRDEQGRADVIHVHDEIGVGLRTGDFSSAIGAYNKAFKANLNRAVGSKSRDGSEILDIEVTGFEGGFGNKGRVKIRVTTKNGGYDSYVSELRSANANDKASFIDGDMIFKQTSSLATIARLMNNSDVNKTETANAQAYLTSGEKAPKIPKEILINRDKAAVSGKTPAEVYQEDNQAKFNGQSKAKVILDYVNQQRIMRSEVPIEELQQEAEYLYNRSLGQQNLVQVDPEKERIEQFAKIMQQYTGNGE